MKQTKLLTRIAAAILVLLLLLTTIVSVLSTTASAAHAGYVQYILDTNGNNPSQIQYGAVYYVRFYFDTLDVNSSVVGGVTTPSISDNWDQSSMVFNISSIEKLTDSEYYRVWGSVQAKYISRTSNRNLSIGNFKINGHDVSGVNMTIDSSYFDGFVSNGILGSGGGVDETTDVTIASQIVVENMVALDSAGNRIDVVTKDSPSFTLEVIFADIGLHYADIDEIRAGDMQAYITGAGGFSLGSSAKGTVSLVTQSDYPRFRARFQNVTYTGAEKNMSFTVFYNIDGFTTIKGEGSATLFSAQSEGEDESGDEAAGIKVPKIIISEYSYGDEAIVAGDEFSLDFTLYNTSADLALENIVVTLTPSSPAGATKGPGLIVASSSNTIYVPSLGPGGSQSHTVSFKARPDAEVTSHLIDIKFSYEYVKSTKEGYTAAPELTESIAIPVSQIDRFMVDPILESPYGQIGEEVYMTVSFINKGKSPTYNVSGSVRIDESISAPAQHFGNLEAGASNTLDFYLTGSEPGTFEGEVVLQYEDDNGNLKEAVSPFVMTVEEPYRPDPGDMEDPGMLEPPAPTGPSALTIVLCVIGGLAIAAPVALYLIKRVKAKGSEEFDETI